MHLCIGQETVAAAVSQWLFIKMKCSAVIATMIKS